MTMGATKIDKPGQSLDCLWVCALSMERQALLRVLRGARRRSVPIGRYWEGRVKWGRVGLLQGGVGAESMQRSLESLLSCVAPRGILACGLSGALTEEFKQGQVVCVETLLQDVAGSTVHRASGGQLSASFPRATQISVSQPICTSADKRQLARASGAALVDMESYTVAACASRWNLPVWVLRAISDDVTTELLPEALSFVRSDGELDSLAALRHLLRHPLNLRDLLALRRGSLKALHNLSESVGALPPEALF